MKKTSKDHNIPICVHSLRTILTLPKFNSSPLKSYRNPIRKSSNHHFSGSMLNFGGVTSPTTEPLHSTSHAPGGTLEISALWSIVVGYHTNVHKIYQQPVTGAELAGVNTSRSGVVSTLFLVKTSMRYPGVKNTWVVTGQTQP